MNNAPPIGRILETAIYVENLDPAVEFYEGILGLGVMSRSDRLIAMDAGRGTVLLLFLRGATTDGASIPGGWIPPHDGQGQGHFALTIDERDISDWKEYLVGQGVEIESEVSWSRGGRSIYFRDPDGHSVELATPGIWPTY